MHLIIRKVRKEDKVHRKERHLPRLFLTLKCCWRYLEECHKSLERNFQAGKKLSILLFTLKRSWIMLPILGISTYKYSLKNIKDTGLCRKTVVNFLSYSQWSIGHRFGRYTIGLIWSISIKHTEWVCWKL